MKFGFDKTDVWFIVLAKGLTGIVYKMFLESSTEFLLNWAMVHMGLPFRFYNFKVAVKYLYEERLLDTLL
jgi:hypothetical protein